MVFYDEKKNNKYDVHGKEDDKVVMRGNSISYVNPEFESIFKNLDSNNKPETKDEKTQENKKKENKNMENIKFTRSEEYFKAIKVAQECAREYKAMKEKEKKNIANQFVYIPFTYTSSNGVSLILLVCVVLEPVLPVI